MSAIIGSSKYQPAKPWWWSKTIAEGLGWLGLSVAMLLQWLGIISGLEVLASAEGVMMLTAYGGASKIVLRVVTDKAVTLRKRWK